MILFDQGIPPSDLSQQRGVRYTYRYSTTVSTSLHGSNAGRNGLALDCTVDIDVISECHLMMQVEFNVKDFLLKQFISGHVDCVAVKQTLFPFRSGIRR